MPGGLLSNAGAFQDRTSSVIESSSAGGKLNAGIPRDGTPLRRVELKIDDGAWQPVTLDTKNRSKYCWTFWSYDWKQPEPGEHTLVSRATDTEGRTQPTADDPRIKLKKTYWEAYQQWPREIELQA